MTRLGQNTDGDLMTKGGATVSTLAQNTQTRAGYGRFRQITSDFLDDLMSRESFAQLNAVEGESVLKAA